MLFESVYSLLFHISMLFIIFVSKIKGLIEIYSYGTCKFILKPSGIGAPNLQIRPKGGMYFQPGLK